MRKGIVGVFVVMVLFTTVVPTRACTESPPVIDIKVNIHGSRVFDDGTTLTFAHVVWRNFATFGSSGNTFCACGLSKIGGILAVIDAQLVDVATGLPLQEFNFQLDSGASQSAAALLTGTDVQGFLAEIQNTVAAGTTVDLTFEVLLANGTTAAQLEQALVSQSGPTVVTAEADVDGNLIHHTSTLPRGQGCTTFNKFELGDTTGWVNGGFSTCTTGSFILDDPTLQESGGVTTQVSGSNSATHSFFTASNTSAGVDDVDGGNCILASPTWSVANDSLLAVSYFHGQRDAGDDAAGDFFLLEYSTNGGSSWNTLASKGDVTSNAAWTVATTQIPAGSNVALRIQCSDGAGEGDLIECGIDDVSICDN